MSLPVEPSSLSTRGDDAAGPARPLPESTPTAETLCLLDEWRAKLAAGQGDAIDHEGIARLDRVVATIHLLRDETRGLRRALTSRATIDQAKGMIMAERHCDADAAFQVLVKMSADTNVPLKDVARALVYKAIGG